MMLLTAEPYMVADARRPTRRECLTARGQPKVVFASRIDAWRAIVGLRRFYLEPYRCSLDEWHIGHRLQAQA